MSNSPASFGLSLDDPRQGYPDVAVAEALAGRPRRGVVVQAGALGVPAEALRRAVVQGEQQRPVRDQAVDSALEQGKRPVVGRVAKLAGAGQYTVSIANPKPIE
jgi:hypothetical protein